MQVLGGAVASVAPGWFESLFKLGAINYMDVLSVHPYVLLSPSAPHFHPQLTVVCGLVCALGTMFCPRTWRPACPSCRPSPPSTRQSPRRFGPPSTAGQPTTKGLATPSLSTSSSDSSPSFHHTTREPGVVTPVRRARYLVRQTLAQGLYGVTRHYWYDAVDDAWDSFGLLKCVPTPSLGMRRIPGRTNLSITEITGTRRTGVRWCPTRPSWPTPTWRAC